jgi:Uma2 family endonuclease
MSAAPDNWIRRHRITVDEYYRMAEVGLLANDARVELIEGEVIDMAPIGSKHAAVVDRLARLLSRLLGDRATIGSQRPVRLDAGTEPQPNVVLLKHRANDYCDAHPAAADALLVVEVSDTTLTYDRKVKLPLYAKHGIPEMWLIDTNNKQWHILRDPRDGHYTSTSTLQSTSIELAALPGVHIDVSGILEL